MGKGRPNVLVAIKGLGIGGAERLVASAASYWDRERFDYQVVYALPWKDQLVPELVDQGIAVHCLEAGGGFSPAAVWRLRDLVHRLRASIVHAHLPTTGIAARLAGGASVVYTEHNLAHSYRGATRLANRLTYGRNRAVVAVSEAVAVSLAGYPGPTPQVIPNGVAPRVAPEAAAAARKELGLEPSAKLVVHVGNVRPGKGHENLVAAVGRLPVSRPDVTVVSIGVEKFPGDLDRLREAARATGVNGRLRFLGRRADALSFVAAADVYVNPSEVEGLPVAVLEAMALERPVVATAVGGVPGIVRNGQTGLLVDPGDPEALARGIMRLLEEPRLARGVASAGRALVDAEYGLEAMVRGIEDIYEQVLHG